MAMIGSAERGGARDRIRVKREFDAELAENAEATEKRKDGIKLSGPEFRDRITVARRLE
jgi:hypothetical protein